MENKSNLDETNYLLDKVIWDKYDMSKTKNNVMSFLLEYKELSAIAIKAISFDTQGLSACYDPNKVFSKVRSNNGGFADKSNRKIDAQRFVENTAPIIASVKKTFTEREKMYYEYCLAENYSEDFILEKINKNSRIGLLPIKNSCILKIAFAFNLEVAKK